MKVFQGNCGARDALRIPEHRCNRNHPIFTLSLSSYKRRFLFINLIADRSFVPH